MKSIKQIQEEITSELKPDQTNIQQTAQSIEHLIEQTIKTNSITTKLTESKLSQIKLSFNEYTKCAVLSAIKSDKSYIVLNVYQNQQNIQQLINILTTDLISAIYNINYHDYTLTIYLN